MDDVLQLSCARTGVLYSRTTELHGPTSGCASWSGGGGQQTNIYGAASRGLCDNVGTEEMMIGMSEQALELFQCTVQEKQGSFPSTRQVQYHCIVY